MKKKNKIYFTADVIKELGISKNTLFNYEAAGKISKAKRTLGNYRYYTESDLKALKRKIWGA